MKSINKHLNTSIDVYNNDDNKGDSSRRNKLKWILNNKRSDIEYLK